MALKPEAKQVEPIEHIVVFYEHELQLADRVAAWLTSAAQDAILIVLATPGHQELFQRAAAEAGFDWPARLREGTLVWVDAHATLDQVVIDGYVERGNFRRLVGSIIASAVASGRPVRAYGEMVAVLWGAGHVVAAVELEKAWNELLRELPFELLCAYPSELTRWPEQPEVLDEVIDLHAAVLGPVAGSVPGGSKLMVSSHFGKEPTAPGDARRFVRNALRQWGRPRALIEDAELVVSEFATNAFLHADSPFTVELHEHRGGVRIEVSDVSRLEPRMRAEVHPLDPSGQGLRLVAKVSADWGFELTAGGKTVWAEL